MPERRTTAPATPDQTIERTLDSKSESEQEKKSWLGLSLTQVVGGALAAMTAAALGSRFSAEGTVVGAALASVIAAVAGALYTASLRRTHETVRVVLRRQPTHAAGMESPSTPAQPVPHGSSAVAPGSLPTLARTADTSARVSRRRALVMRSVVGAAAAFALAAGALTMYEALTGHALSGGGGTTFSQVQQDGPEDRPTKEQAPAPSESAEPSSTTESSAEPSATPEAEPSSTAAPPRAAPSQTPQPPR